MFAIIKEIPKPNFSNNKACQQNLFTFSLLLSLNSETVKVSQLHRKVSLRQKRWKKFIREGKGVTRACLTGKTSVSVWNRMRGVVFVELEHHHSGLDPCWKRSVGWNWVKKVKKHFIGESSYCNSGRKDVKRQLSLDFFLSDTRFFVSKNKNCPISKRRSS